MAHGKALLGYTVLGPVALLLVAESVRVSAVLPGGHQIKTVTQSRWHRINLLVRGMSCKAAVAAAAVKWQPALFGRVFLVCETL